MLYEIKNDKLSVSADTFGAELHSIKLDGKEYLWQCGDCLETLRSYPLPVHMLP